MIFRIVFSFLCIILVACNVTNREDISDLTTKLQWEKIFNGEDLSGWTMKINGFPLGENFANTFIADDGILRIRYDGYGDDFSDRFGAVFFDKKLSDFRLKLDYRFVGETAPGAPEWGFRDSGIQFHGQSPSSMNIDQAFPVCLEFNLHGGDGINERPTGEICTNGTKVEIEGILNENFCTPPKIARTFHGDQWVNLEIEVKEGVIKHFVNGEEILKYSSPIYDEKHDLGKTFIMGESNILSEGYISLQSNSHPIDFRNIELIEY